MESREQAAREQYAAGFAAMVAHQKRSRGLRKTVYDLSQTVYWRWGFLVCAIEVARIRLTLKLSRQLPVTKLRRHIAQLDEMLDSLTTEIYVADREIGFHAGLHGERFEEAAREGWKRGWYEARSVDRTKGASYGRDPFIAQVVRQAEGRDGDTAGADPEHQP